MISINEHEPYQELISRLLDDDTLTDKENAALQAHLDECPECRLMYQAFKEMSGFLGGELEEPPTEMRENIMAEIRREEIRRKNQRIAARTGLVAAAAVLILVVGVAPRILSTSSASGSDSPAMAGGTLYAAAAEETAPAPHLYDINENENEPGESISPNDVEGTEIEDPNVTWEGDYIEQSPEGEETESGLDPYFDENTDDKLSMDSLLLQLSGVETDIDFSSRAGNPVYLIDTDIGVLEIYRYNNSLFFTDPFTGIPCEAMCSEASLIRFLQE